MGEHGSVNKGKFIEELTAAEPFGDCLFAVRGCAFLESNGKRRAILTLADRTGTRNAIRWDISETEEEALRGAQFVVVSGEISGPGSKFPHQITIARFAVVTLAPDDHAHFVAQLPADQAQTLQRFADLRGRIGNGFLADLLNRFFDKEPFATKFAEAVAAGSHHHAFRGGLLRHTVEVAELSRAACGVLPFLRHDLLVTGALLHDVGKVWEMDHGVNAGQYTVSGSLIGHIQDGAFRVRTMIQQIENFPPGLRDALIHLMVSHHERPEWGSPREPALPEAIVLALCDRLSAHATEAADAYERARGTGQISVKHGDRWICVADLKLDDLDLQGLDEPISAESGDLTLPGPNILFSSGKLRLPPGETATIPLRGLVAAGDGERSSEFPEETGEACAVVVPPGGVDYLVRVTGESMMDAGILPGDRAYVRYQQSARPGDIVVAWVPGSGNVVKRYTESPMGSFLHSENPDRKSYPPIPVTPETQIQGVVTRVERDFLGR